MGTVIPMYDDDAETRNIAPGAHIQAVERAIQVMHAHLHEALTLEDLAAAAYLSPYHFHRIFRHFIGIPPGEFLSALRFQMARRLLLTTTLSVTDVCFTVGYTSPGSFTSRFTQVVGLSPRRLRQRAHTFEPPAFAPGEPAPIAPTPISTGRMKQVLHGQIITPATFQGTIYVGLFTSPIPQGAPVRCAKLYASGNTTSYLLFHVPDGAYHLRAAAFPLSADRQSSLLPGERQLVGSSAQPLIVHDGLVFGETDLVLHPPRLTGPPLVIGLPLL